MEFNTPEIYYAPFFFGGWCISGAGSIHQSRCGVAKFPLYCKNVRWNQHAELLAVAQGGG